MPAQMVRMCLFVTLLAAPAAGLDQNQTIRQFFHSRWTVRDGAPGQIEAIAQTIDGYLWLGTATGLVRFDGVRFESYPAASGEQLVSTSVSTLFALPSGGLWVGFTVGGASFIQDGRTVNYSAQEGLPSTTVYKFARDSGGSMWAATGLGLQRLDGSKWVRVGSDWNYPGKLANSLLLDNIGVLWATTEETVVFLQRGDKEFRRTGIRLPWPAQMGQAPDGSRWLADNSVRPFSSAGPDIQLETVPDVSRRRFSSQGILFDRDGGLWVANETGGVLRVPFPNRLSVTVRFGAAGTESYVSKDGLTGSARVVFEDREGNIWVGTGGGLDQFRRNKLIQVAWPSSSYGYAMVPDHDGIVWAGTLNEPLMRFENGALTGRAPLRQITCGYRDRDGIIWWGGREGIWRFEKGRYTPIPLPSGLVVSKINGAVIIHDVQAITKDLDGALWVSIARDGVFRLVNGAWTRYGEPAITAITDSGGDVWLGYPGNRISRVHSGRARNYSAGDGFHVGNVTALHESAGLVCIGGEFGLAVFDGSRVTMVEPDGTEAFNGISGIVGTASGDLWLNANAGVFHMNAAEIRHVKADHSYRVKYELFDTQEFLPGAPAPLRPFPTAVAGTDGRLWFANGNGILWLDPLHIPRNPLPPPVSIQALTVDNRRYPPTPDLQLPVGTANVELDYTALSLSIPGRVQFRYKLEGADRDWHHAGSRRQAYYPNPLPRKYRFRVVASNNDGVWNETGAVLDFSVLPAWYQTEWFRVAVAGAVILLLWAIYQLRVRQIAASVSARFDERLAERTRLARELHDTLLQTIQGSKMVADDALADDADALRMRRALVRLSGWLAQATVEGRAALNAIRTSTTQRNHLADAFQEAAEECRPKGQMEISLSVAGKVKEIHPIVREEVYRIGYEAIRNACNHSGGARLEVELSYTRDLILRVRDNGKGIDPELAAHGKEGHFGLEGMKERAARIAGRLTVFSTGKSGTEVDLIVPGNIAFRIEKPKQGRLFRRIGQLLSIGTRSDPPDFQG